MWAAVQDLFTRILAHPFIAGLTDGSLWRGAFAYYVIQDSNYLVDYARALATCLPGREIACMLPIRL